MLLKIFLALSSISPYSKKLLWKQWYQFLASHYPTKEWSFMNYGYTAIDDHFETLKLNEADEPDRYAMQLYHHVTRAVDLLNLDVLEIGSGRGGGASYVARYLKPKTLIGLDYSDSAIQFCKRAHAVDGLSFIKGDAESLAFDAGRFDAVINIESSHCYGSMETFLANVKRVLRQNGYFLKREDITANVLRSLDLDDQRKLLLIRALFRDWLLKPFQEFAGVKGSKIYSGFQSGTMAYLHYVLQK
jgi:ubiquinone/menaquinone biosynthesis C-methylase UbiE